MNILLDFFVIVSIIKIWNVNLEKIEHFAYMLRNLECQVHESRQLEVVKQEMARVNVDILGISELKQTGWVNLTQMTIISTTAGRNPSEEME